MTSTWHIVAPEWPPTCGGVGDYSAQLATALARCGDTVHVWCPRAAERVGEVAVHGLPDVFGPAARQQMQRAFASTPGTVLVQYVPSAFGWRGMNVPFCGWLKQRAARGADVRVMVHEPFFYFALEKPWRNALALVQRAMVRMLIRASRHLYVSSETWLRLLTPYGPLPPSTVLPIPATIPTDAPADAIERWRGRVNPDREVLVGHFGTYGDHVGRELRGGLVALGRSRPGTRVLLAGAGSVEFARSLGGGSLRVEATGRLDAADVAAVLRVCDLLIAPFPDGVTTRRTSVMAALSSGRAVVTTAGALTEAVWRQSNAVALVPAGDHERMADEIQRLSLDPAARASLGARGRAVYDERFALHNTVRSLRRTSEPVLVR